MTTLSIFQRKKLLLRQMLPHTWIGHPVASLLSYLGCEKAADDFHYWTLPRRAKRRVKQSDVPWICDRRLRLWDMVVVPIYSLLDSCGCFDAAAAVCRTGPWQACLELGACYSVNFYNTKICKYCGITIGSSLIGWADASNATAVTSCEKSPNGRHAPKGTK